MMSFPEIYNHFSILPDEPVHEHDGFQYVCPQEKCPGSGGFPPSVNATALLESLSSSSQNRYDFMTLRFGVLALRPPARQL